VVAAAALERLHISSQAAEFFSPTVLLPQVGQGAIAVECRDDDRATVELLELIDDGPAHRAVAAERALLVALGGSCALPVGGWAIADGAALELRGMVATADGRIVLHARGRGDDPEGLGREVARSLLEDCGAADLLDSAAPLGASG
jgi:hydroxymethylbilane synthase